MPGVAGSQPSDLSNAVPGADVAAANIPSPMKMPAGAAQALPAAPLDNPGAQAARSQQPSLDDIFGGPSSSGGNAPPAAKPSLDDIFSDGDIQKQAAGNGSADFLTRMKAGFATDDSEKQDYLKQQYGDGNVRKTQQGFFIKEDGKWKKFNNDWLGIGDPANLARQGVVEAGALPAEAAGAGAATAEAISGFGAPATLPTMAVARFAGGTMGDQAAKAVAHDVIGIPNHEDAVNSLLGSAQQGGMRAIFGHVADFLSSNGLIDGAKGLAKDVINPTENAVSDAVDKYVAPQLNKIQGDIAKLQAPTKSATLQDALNNTLPERKAASGIQDALDTAQTADKAGIDLRPDELAPNNPHLQAIADKAMASPKMREYVLARGQQAADAIETFGNSFSDSDGKQSAIDALKQGSVLDRAYGKMLGVFRKKAIDNAESPMRDLSLPSDDWSQQSDLSMMNANPQRSDLGLGMPQGSIAQKFRNQSSLENAQQSFLDANSSSLISSDARQGSFQPGEEKKINMTNFAQAISSARQRLGFDGTVPPSAGAFDDLATGLNMRRSDVATLVATVNRMSDKLANNEGSLAPRDVDSMYKMYKGFADSNFDPTGKKSSVFSVYKDLKNGLRDDFANGIGSLLSPEDKAAYQTQMQRFSDLKNASAGVKQILQTDSPTVNSIVQYLRGGGVKNPDRIENLKTIIQQEHPEGWDSIAKAYFDQTMGEHVMQGAEGERMGGYDWAKLERTLNPDKKQFTILQSVVGDDKADSLLNLTKTMASAQRNDQAFKDPAVLARVMRAVSGAAKGDLTGIVDVFAADHNAMKLLSSEKANSLLSKMGPKDQATIGEVLNKATAKIAASVPKNAVSGMAAQQATNAIRNTQGQPPAQQ